MSDPENGDRVTNRQLYDTLTEFKREVAEQFATKGDVKVWVVGGLLGGQVVASAVTALVTHLSPPQQAAALAHYAYHLFA